MAIYKVKTSVPVENGLAAVRWAGSMAEVKAAKSELVEKYKLHPRKELEHEEVDIPSGKAGLLGWLNEAWAMEGCPSEPQAD